MKNGLEEYGEMLVGGVVAVMILALIFSAGLLSVVGKEHSYRKKTIVTIRIFKTFQKCVKEQHQKFFITNKSSGMQGI